MKEFVGERASMLYGLVLFVNVVVFVGSGEVGFIAGDSQSCYGRQEMEKSYPMFIIVVMPAPFAPRFCSEVLGRKM